MAKPLAYSYVRMSTEAQLAGDSLRRQLDASQAYALEHNLELAQDFELHDLGISAFTGQNSATGALGRFLEGVRLEKIKPGSYLLVESLDRISRQQPRLALPQFLELINRGIVIVTISDKRKYTPDTANLEELMYSLVVMSRAHEESATKSLRVSAAWANKRRRGSELKLTARCPAWLHIAPTRESFALNPPRVTIVQQIFADALAGMGSYSIARRLNQSGTAAFVGRNGWHTSSVSKIITNRAVIGEFQPHRLAQGRRIPDGEPIKDYFPQIIDEATFNAVQALRFQKKAAGGGRRGSGISNLFSKLAACQYCGGSMRYENKGVGPKGGSYLVCDNAARKKGCSGNRWRYSDFEVSFLAFVEEVDLGSILTTTSEAARRASLEHEAKSLEGQLLQTEVEQENLYQLLEHKGINIAAVGDKLVQCEHKIEALKTAQAEVRRKLSQSIAEAKNYYETKQVLRDSISELVNQKGGDIYKSRAQIAARLRSIVSRLVIAGEGRAPLRAKISAELDRVAPNEDPGLLEQVKATINRSAGVGDGRYFAVSFRDGSYRIVFPANDDPLSFSQQLIPSGAIVPDRADPN